MPAISSLLAQEKIDRLDAQLILSHVLQKPRSFFIAWPDHVVSTGEYTIFESLVALRAQGYPLAYITGLKSFWDMDLIVTPDVLIPRPETELLIETALPLLKSGDKVLELATGSGAIACALARERDDIHILATDISRLALNTAKSNAQKYALKNIAFMESDWFTAIPAQQFDIIIANPPYLAETDTHLATDIRFEPRGALVSGPIGDEDAATIISQAPKHLKPKGLLILEHGAQQGPRCRDLFQQRGYVEVFTRNDLAGLARVTGGTWL